MKVVRITGGPLAQNMKIVTEDGVDLTPYVSAVHFKCEARGPRLATATLTVNAYADVLAEVEGL